MNRPTADARRPGRAGEEQDTEIVDVALALDLMAVLVEAGLGLIAALALLGEHLPGAGPLRAVAAHLLLGADWRTAWRCVPADGDLTELGRELRFAHSTGAPTAALLRATASALRRTRRRRAEQAAARLATHLVMPLGLCLLPAFLCLGVIPLVLALLP